MASSPRPWQWLGPKADSRERNLVTAPSPRQCPQAQGHGKGSRPSLEAMAMGRRIFDAVWSPFGSPVAPFWLHGFLLAHFGSLWYSFGSRCLPFCLLLASFGSVLQYPGIIFHVFIISPRKYRAKSSFYVFSLKITFSVNQITFSRSVPNAPQQKIHPLS